MPTAVNIGVSGGRGGIGGKWVCGPLYPFLCLCSLSLFHFSPRSLSSSLAHIVQSAPLFLLLVVLLFVSFILCLVTRSLFLSPADPLSTSCPGSDHCLSQSTCLYKNIIFCSRPLLRNRATISVPNHPCVCQPYFILCTCTRTSCHSLAFMYS